MNDKYEPASHVAWRRVDEEVVVLDLNTSVYYAFNESAARIWELLCDGKSLERVVETIVAEFDSPPATVKKDVQALLKDLRAEKLMLSV
jgi:hypothetical protein